MAARRIKFQLRGRALSVALDLDPARPNENIVLKHLECGQYYEPDVSHLMLKIVQEGDIVVDVGANAGFFTTLLASLTGPSGHVICFEPGENCIPSLKNNIAINNFGHVSVIEKPASDSVGGIRFFINSDNSGGNALWDVGTFPGNVKSAAAPQVLTLQATTVDDEVERLNLPPPKLIKIDTEGAELQVLSGCRKLLAGRRTPFVIAEHHAFGLQKMGATPRMLRSFMAEFGYATFGIFYDGRMPQLIPLASEITEPYLINLLFTTPEDIGRIWTVAHHDPGTAWLNLVLQNAQSVMPSPTK